MKWRFLYHKAPADFILATEEVLTRSVGRGQSPPTVRLNVFDPPAVLVGRHQCLMDEVDMEAALRKGYHVNRRCSGGGAIIMNIDSPGWEIWIPQDMARELSIEDIYRQYSKPILRLLRYLGLNANFRPKNDIEVHGRKISGMGLYTEENGILICGTILLDLDVRSMLEVLKISAEKLSDKAVKTVEERITTVKRELGYKPDINELIGLFKKAFEEEFNIELEEGGLADHELKDLEETIKIYRSKEWIYDERSVDTRVYTGVYVKKTRGGLFRIYYKLHGKAIENIMITGDFFAQPQRVILDLESRLKWSPLDQNEIHKIVREVFTEQQAGIIGLTSIELANLLYEALKSK